MTSKWANLKLIFIAIVLFLLSPPILSKGVVENNDNTFKIILPDTPKAKLSKVEIVQDKQQFIVKGKIERKFRNKYVPNGHIDVFIIDEDGSTTTLATGNYSRKRLQKRSRNAKMDTKPTYFQVILDSIPPENSTIKVLYHKGEVKQAHDPDDNTAKQDNSFTISF